MKNSESQLYTVDDLRKIESFLINKGIGEKELMERAGAALLNNILRKWPNITRIAIFCGSGNNGGDGYVLAALAQKSGLLVDVCQIEPPASVMCKEVAKLMCLNNINICRSFEAAVKDAELIVDAMLGIGMKKLLRPSFFKPIDLINKSGKPVLAVDIPSGLVSDTGADGGSIVKSSLTVTFLGLKPGLFMNHGPDSSGDIKCELLAPNFLDARKSSFQLISKQWVDKHILPRPKLFHKGLAGRVGIIGGSKGMYGAAALAGLAALRSGAGLVLVGCQTESVSPIIAACPELMVKNLDELNLKEFIDQLDVLIVGPGLGTGSWSKTILKKLSGIEIPIVLDADALNILSEENIIFKDSVLTPHPKEASRLLGCSTNDIQKDRISSGVMISKKFKSVCLLKGTGSLIVDNRHMSLLCDRGNPGMSTAGMGDILSGTIGAYIGQGLSTYHASAVSMWLHATAGDLAARKKGPIGIIARDLLPYLQLLRNKRKTEI